MQVWDESLSKDDGEGCGEDDDDDDDDDTFVGSWVFRVEELRLPSAQRHAIALQQESEADLAKAVHAPPAAANGMGGGGGEAFIRDLPETLMTVKV